MKIEVENKFMTEKCMSEVSPVILNPFLTAASNLILSTMGERPVKEKIAITDADTDFNKDLAVIFGVSGGIFGWVALMLKKDVACGIASSKLHKEVTDLNEELRSAISDVGNTIMGNAKAELENNGFVCSITPPAVISGRELRIAKLRGIQMLTVNFNTSRGRVDVILGLRAAGDIGK